MTITINNQEITVALETIRADIGGEKRDDFIPRRYHRPIDLTLPEGDIKELLSHPSGLLIQNNQPVFVYIRDHTTMEFSLDPHKRRKVHFSVCSTLRQMQRDNRFESRYHVTNRVDNQYYVDTQHGYTSKESLEKLYPCQNCLSEIGYNCFSYKLPRNIKYQIVESFDAKDAVDLLWQHFEEFRQQTATLRPETARTGYLSNQEKISKRFRQKKKFTCEECSVKSKRLTDMHHKDGDKRNNRDDNLQCLCKLCHQKIHPHYYVSPENKQEIIIRRTMNIRRD